MILDKENCFYLGKITKTKGVRGQLYAFLDCDNPTDYHQLEQVLIEINGMLTPYFLETFDVQGNKALMSFEDLKSDAEAKNFVNAELYLPLAALPKLSGNKFYYHEVDNFEIADANNKVIGKLDSILDQKTNPLLSITHNSGKEILLPLRDEFIIEVNREKKLMKLDFPDGLLELYLEN